MSESKFPKDVIDIMSMQTTMMLYGYVKKYNADLGAMKDDVERAFREIVEKYSQDATTPSS